MSKLDEWAMVCLLLGRRTVPIAVVHKEVWCSRKKIELHLAMLMKWQMAEIDRLKVEVASLRKQIG